MFWHELYSFDTLLIPIMFLSSIIIVTGDPISIKHSSLVPLIFRFFSEKYSFLLQGLFRNYLNSGFSSTFSGFSGSKFLFQIVVIFLLHI